MKPRTKLIKTELVDYSQIADNFARDLSQLSRMYGIGIQGGTLFIMIPEDQAAEYVVDKESNLHFGSENQNEQVD